MKSKCSVGQKVEKVEKGTQTVEGFHKAHLDNVEFVLTTLYTTCNALLVVAFNVEFVLTILYTTYDAHLVVSRAIVVGLSLAVHAELIAGGVEGGEDKLDVEGHVGNHKEGVAGGVRRPPCRRLHRLQRRVCPHHPLYHLQRPSSWNRMLPRVRRSCAASVAYA